MDPDIMLSQTHFLSLTRPQLDSERQHGVVDTTTLAAHDFDVDNRTGFMPPQPPMKRLPVKWEAWEQLLDDAIMQQIQLGDTPDLPDSEVAKSSQWRSRVRQAPILSTDEFKKSELTLRRAHTVLAWIMHFYIHSLPPTDSVIIPASITLPLLRVSKELRLPPVLTYSDDVLYNWTLKSPSSAPTPALTNLRSLLTFTATRDEEEFYLTSARMELRGVEALELMREMMDETFVGDELARNRITKDLHQLASVIDDLKKLLVSVKQGCNPETFYHKIRPWFRGADSAKERRSWVFEGLEEDKSLSYPEELSGPSAGQSSLIHALDAFLGVDQYSHDSSITGQSNKRESSSAEAKSAFLSRMQAYMPRHHRNFLNHLATSPWPLRELVRSTPQDIQLTEAYNTAVLSLKSLRDSHFVIVATYIIAPSSRQRAEQKDAESGTVQERPPLKGTGGTNLAKFLKDVRDGTRGALLPTNNSE